MTKHSDAPYLYHILDAIHDIENSVKNVTKKEFIKNKDIRDANIRRLEIIGEAVKNVSKGLKQKHPDIKWKQIAGMRDKLIHHYFGVDVEAVWKVIKKDVPELKKKINTIVKSLEEEG